MTDISPIPYRHSIGLIAVPDTYRIPVYGKKVKYRCNIGWDLGGDGDSDGGGRQRKRFGAAAKYFETLTPPHIIFPGQKYRSIFLLSL